MVLYNDGYIAFPSSSINGALSSQALNIYEVIGISDVSYDNISDISNFNLFSIHGYCVTDTIPFYSSLFNYLDSVKPSSTISDFSIFTYNGDYYDNHSFFNLLYFTLDSYYFNQIIGSYIYGDFLSNFSYGFGNGDFNLDYLMSYKSSSGYYFNTSPSNGYTSVVPLFSSYGFYNDTPYNFLNVSFNSNFPLLKYLGYYGFSFVGEKINTVQGLLSTINDLNSQVSSLSSQLENANQTIEDLNNQLTDMTNKYNDVKAQYEALSKSLNVSDSQEYKSLENQYEQVKTAYENLTNTYNDYKTKYNEKTYQNGYNAGQLDASGSAEVNLFSSLFLAIVGVPIEILNGFASFSIFNVSIITIAMTFLFIGLILWVIKKFI